MNLRQSNFTKKHDGQLSEIYVVIYQNKTKQNMYT